MSEPIQFNDRLERLLFGTAILGGNVIMGGILAFVTLPEQNVQLLAQVVGGLNAAVGIMVAATWKTSSVERQQAQANATLANAVAAPMKMTTEVTVEKTDGQQDALRVGGEAGGGSIVDTGSGGGAAGDGSGKADTAEPDAAAATYGTARAG